MSRPLKPPWWCIPMNLSWLPKWIHWVLWIIHEPLQDVPNLSKSPAFLTWRVEMSDVSIGMDSWETCWLINTEDRATLTKEFTHSSISQCIEYLFCNFSIKVIFKLIKRHRDTFYKLLTFLKFLTSFDCSVLYCQLRWTICDTLHIHTPLWETV